MLQRKACLLAEGQTSSPTGANGSPDILTRILGFLVDQDDQITRAVNDLTLDRPDMFSPIAEIEAHALALSKQAGRRMVVEALAQVVLAAMQESGSPSEPCMVPVLPQQRAGDSPCA